MWQKHLSVDSGQSLHLAGSVAIIMEDLSNRYLYYTHCKKTNKQYNEII